MNPREKALNIVNQMWESGDWPQAKRYAMIAVEMVLNDCSAFREPYWRQVKQEIEKL